MLPFKQCRLNLHNHLAPSYHGCVHKDDINVSHPHKNSNN